MTSPDPEPLAPQPETPAEREALNDALEALDEAIEEERRPIKEKLTDNAVVGWAKAIALGIGDTARDMLDAGREGAREAMDEGWERFDRKTKHRRG